MRASATGNRDGSARLPFTPSREPGWQVLWMARTEEVFHLGGWCGWKARVGEGCYISPPPSRPRQGPERTDQHLVVERPLQPLEGVPSKIIRIDAIPPGGTIMNGWSYSSSNEPGTVRVGRGSRWRPFRRVQAKGWKR